ncbi:hypothetical protein AKJ16_DCAP11624 [Drosera capensis]
MDDSSGEVAVFIDTNFDTRLAVAVSPHITAGDLKRDIEIAHSICFPEIGSISLEGLMVKKKNIFYHLPDSIPLKHVCRIVGRSWFLRAEGSVLEVSQKVFVSEACTRRSWANADCILERPLGEVKVNRLNGKCCIDSSGDGCDEERGLHYEGKCGSDRIFETSGEELREVSSESVSGIIDRYFSNLLEVNQLVNPSSSEVASKSIQNQPFLQQSNSINGKQSRGIQDIMIETPTRVLPMSLPKDPGSSTRNTSQRIQIGRSFVTASNNLFSSQGTQKPVISLCSSKKRKSSVLNTDSSIKSLVFEIGDDA